MSNSGKGTFYFSLFFDYVNVQRKEYEKQVILTEISSVGHIISLNHRDEFDSLDVLPIILLEAEKEWLFIRKEKKEMYSEENHYSCPTLRISEVIPLKSSGLIQLPLEFGQDVLKPYEDRMIEYYLILGYRVVKSGLYGGWPNRRQITSDQWVDKSYSIEFSEIVGDGPEQKKQALLLAQQKLAELIREKAKEDYIRQISEDNVPILKIVREIKLKGWQFKPF
ncbi:MAG: hypothetical protein NTX82_01025 [Candidatus Parcubacteria bacterium]|nr:hypothetical protein [Candidatus Parcubacteria bacterium]